MRDASIATVLEHALVDSKILLVTGDLGFGVLTAFADALPGQFFNAGVAEQNMTAMAAGLALEGFKVFTYSIGNFPTLRCIEQIRNDVCYHDADVKILCVGGGFSYGQLGMSHHATEDIAILRALPNMTVVVPCDEWEAAEAVAALIKAPGPAYIRLDKSSAGPGPRVAETFELGKARVLREGADVTLVGCGGIVADVLRAAEDLAEQGVNCRVLGIHTVKPIDAAALVAAARETGAIVTVEEHNVVGGLGSAVAEVLMDQGCGGVRFRRIGLNDQYPAVVGEQSYLRTIYNLDAPAIAAAVLDVLAKNSA